MASTITQSHRLDVKLKSFWKICNFEGSWAAIPMFCSLVAALQAYMIS
jgi:hypothetical protein